MHQPVETVDQIVARLTSGDSWQGSSTISYSMTGLWRTDAGGNRLPVGADDPVAAAITTMTAAEKTYAREAFELWDDLIFQQITENSDRSANIAFNYTTSAVHSSNGYTLIATDPATKLVLHFNCETAL